LGQEEPEFHLASPSWTGSLLTLRSLIRLRRQSLNEPVSIKPEPSLATGHFSGVTTAITPNG
jgi:hypothetical protein